MKPKPEWLRLALIGSLTLGLAPFAPEPHILGKVRWIAGGAVGMQPMDWFDTLLHGTPWLVLIGLSIWWVVDKLQTLNRPAPLDKEGPRAHS